MIDDTIQKIEKRVQNGRAITDENKSALLTLLTTLKSELNALPEAHNEQAESITGFMERSTHEATREEPNPQLLQLAVDGLSASVQDFESSHPRVAEIVNTIAGTLANLGI